ncbi:MAG: IPT/TIG domain-containing protein, partial [Planctomycetes bacterium]|nr:IPT/TIG domain-containing protein [Planctomycetota bacterium]
MRNIAPLCLLLLIALFGSVLVAQSTSGTLSTSDDSFTHPGSPMVGAAGGPRRYRAIEFNVVTTGNYTFTYTPTGYTGALYLYQNGFQPASPITNIWTFGNTGSPVAVTHNLSVPGKFEVVLTSTSNNATGSWTLNITGPGTLQMGPVVNSCSPTSGSTGGGTNATLTGSFFTGVNSVTFGGSSVSNLVVVNDTTITCTTPSHSAGNVTISANKPTGFGLTGERFNSFTYNLTPTSVSSINRRTPSSSTTNAASVVYRVTFAASAGGISTSNFTTTTTGSISGTSVTGVSGSGTTWDVTVNTGSGDGTIRLDMTNDSGVNPSLTNIPFTSGQTYTIDKTAPTVSSIVRAGTNPTNATSVDFTINFSEAVTGVGTTNFSIDASGPSGASVTGVSGSGTSRTVSVNTGSGDGTLSIDLLTVTGVADVAGNALGSAFVAGEAYTIDKTGPGISIGAPSVSGTISGPVDYIVSYT